MIPMMIPMMIHCLMFFSCEIPMMIPMIPTSDRKGEIRSSKEFFFTLQEVHAGQLAANAKTSMLTR